MFTSIIKTAGKRIRQGADFALNSLLEAALHNCKKLFNKYLDTPIGNISSLTSEGFSNLSLNVKVINQQMFRITPFKLESATIGHIKGNITNAKLSIDSIELNFCPNDNLTKYSYQRYQQEQENASFQIKDNQELLEQTYENFDVETFQQINVLLRTFPLDIKNVVMKFRINDRGDKEVSKFCKLPMVLVAYVKRSQIALQVQDNKNCINYGFEEIYVHLNDQMVDELNSSTIFYNKSILIKQFQKDDKKRGFFYRVSRSEFSFYEQQLGIVLGYLSYIDLFYLQNKLYQQKSMQKNESGEKKGEGRGGGEESGLVTDFNDLIRQLFENQSLLGDQYEAIVKKIQSINQSIVEIPSDYQVEVQFESVNVYILDEQEEKRWLKENQTYLKYFNLEVYQIILSGSYFKINEDSVLVSDMKVEVVHIEKELEQEEDEFYECEDMKESIQTSQLQSIKFELQESDYSRIINELESQNPLRSIFLLQASQQTQSQFHFILESMHFDLREKNVRDLNRFANGTLKQLNSSESNQISHLFDNYENKLRQNLQKELTQLKNTYLADSLSDKDYHLHFKQVSATYDNIQLQLIDLDIHASQAFKDSVQLNEIHLFFKGLHSQIDAHPFLTVSSYKHHDKLITPCVKVIDRIDYNPPQPLQTFHKANDTNSDLHFQEPLQTQLTHLQNGYYIQNPFHILYTQRDKNQSKLLQHIYNNDHYYRFTEQPLTFFPPDQKQLSQNHLTQVSVGLPHGQLYLDAYQPLTNPFTLYQWKPIEEQTQKIAAYRELRKLTSTLLNIWETQLKCDFQFQFLYIDQKPFKFLGEYITLRYDKQINLFAQNFLLAESLKSYPYFGKPLKIVDMIDPQIHFYTFNLHQQEIMLYRHQLEGDLVNTRQYYSGSLGQYNFKLPQVDGKSCQLMAEVTEKRKLKVKLCQSAYRHYDWSFQSIGRYQDYLEDITFENLVIDIYPYYSSSFLEEHSTNLDFPKNELDLSKIKYDFYHDTRSVCKVDYLHFTQKQEKVEISLKNFELYFLKINGSLYKINELLFRNSKLNTLDSLGFLKLLYVSHIDLTQEQSNLQKYKSVEADIGYSEFRLGCFIFEQVERHIQVQLFMKKQHENILEQRSSVGHHDDGLPQINSVQVDNIEYQYINGKYSTQYLQEPVQDFQYQQVKLEPEENEITLVVNIQMVYGKFTVNDPFVHEVTKEMEEMATNLEVEYCIREFSEESGLSKRIEDYLDQEEFKKEERLQARRYLQNNRDYLLLNLDSIRLQCAFNSAMSTSQSHSNLGQRASAIYKMDIQQSRILDFIASSEYDQLLVVEESIGIDVKVTERRKEVRINLQPMKFRFTTQSFRFLIGLVCDNQPYQAIKRKIEEQKENEFSVFENQFSQDYGDDTYSILERAEESEERRELLEVESIRINSVGIELGFKFDGVLRSVGEVLHDTVRRYVRQKETREVEQQAIQKKLNELQGAYLIPGIHLGKQQFLGVGDLFLCVLNSLIYYLEKKRNDELASETHYLFQSLVYQVQSYSFSSVFQSSRTTILSNPLLSFTHPRPQQVPRLLQTLNDITPIPYIYFLRIIWQLYPLCSYFIYPPPQIYYYIFTHAPPPLTGRTNLNHPVATLLSPTNPKPFQETRSTTQSHDNSNPRIREEQRKHPEIAESGYSLFLLFVSKLKEKFQSLKNQPYLQQISSINNYNIHQEDGVKQGRWTQQEHQQYLEFMGQNKKLMSSKKEKKEKKIFKIMSNFIQTRTAEQCRSHYQKFQ